MMTATSRPRLVVAESLWSAKDVAKLFNVSEQWVWKQVRHNSGIPFVRLGKRVVRFRESEIREWLERLPRGGA